MQTSTPTTTKDSDRHMNRLRDDVESARERREHTKDVDEKAKQTWVLALTAVASFMVILDALVVSTALSTIRRDLGTSIEQLEWTVNAYTLSFAVLLMTAAALGDRFGRRRLFVAGLGLFAAASGVCALAPDIGSLIAARAVQGAGAATIMPLALALLNAAFPPQRRGWALGIFGSVTGLAALVGPIIGGAIVQGISWRWIFWLNVPIGLLAIPLVLRRIDEGFGPVATLDIAGPRPGGRRSPRARVGSRARERRRLGQPRGHRDPCRRGAADRCIRRVGAAHPRADAADAPLPLPCLLCGQRGDLPL